jgi:hypothetical protein
MRRAGDWLVGTQDVDGCWRKFQTPFATSGEKAYDTHVAWGLLEAARLETNRGYQEAALRNINWALGLQSENGWFEKCCLSDHTQPLTHTLGYVLRGIIEAYRYTKDANLLKASQKTANGLLKALRKDGFLPGRLNKNWQGTVAWSCLTGDVQIVICWLILYKETGDLRYRDAAFSVNSFVRRTVKITGRIEIKGGVKGSLPINGEYSAYEYPNWANKFFIDANLLEKSIRNISEDSRF